MDRDWNALARLMECEESDGTPDQILRKLEDEWNAMLGGLFPDTVPDETLDEFFSRSLPVIEALWVDEKDVGPWRDRVRDYVWQRRNFMLEFRPRIYHRANRKELRQFKAVFDVWHLSVNDEELESSLGRLFESYRLELAARLAPIWEEREHLFREASRVCLVDPVSSIDPLSDALRRRGLVLESQALRIAAFSLLNRNPADLRPVENLFCQAKARALDAQEAWYDPEDIHPHYLGFWAEVTRLRCAEVEGDISRAREAHRLASEHLEAFFDPDVLFREPNLWWSSGDFKREHSLLDVIEALKEGPTGLPFAVKALTEWVHVSQEELAGTNRLIKMGIRLRALKLLEEVWKGEDVTRKLHGLFQEVMEYSAIGRHSWEIARQVGAASKGRVSIADAVAHVACLFPLDAQGPVMGVIQVRWDLLPHWYESTFNRYRNHGQVDAAVLVLLWYARTVAEYIWDVYAKNLAEQRGWEVGPSPDFMLASFSEIRQALLGLARAMCWAGSPGRALDSFIELLEQAEGVPPENIAVDILPAVIEETAWALFPLALQVKERDPEDSKILAALRFSSGVREMFLAPVVEPPSRGSYVYIKPRFKQSGETLRQDAPLTLYPARSFGQPTAVSLICEGVSDQSMFEIVLDHLDTYWRQMHIEILPAEGDKLPAQYDALKRKRPVVVADADKRYGIKGSKWDKMWEQCCYGFVLEPDLERVNLDALSFALTDYWGIEVRAADLQEISAGSRTGKEFEKKVLARYTQHDFKTQKFGKLLGQKFVKLGIPPMVREIALCMLQIANGREMSCRPELMTPFHKCLPRVA